MRIESRYFKDSKTHYHDAHLDMETLRPCPFCGGSDVVLMHTWTDHYWIECNGCGAHLPDPVCGKSGATDRNPGGTRKSHMTSAARAVVAWNTRVKP